MTSVVYVARDEAVYLSDFRQRYHHLAAGSWAGVYSSPRFFAKHHEFKIC